MPLKRKIRGVTAVPFDTLPCAPHGARIRNKQVLAVIAKLKRSIVLIAALLLLSACSTIVSRATNSFASNLTNAILDQDDIATVRDGVPAYLLMIDAMIAGDPQNPDTLLAGAKLYGAYTGGFVDQPERGKRLAQRAYDYARRALCISEKTLCAQLDGSFEAFSGELSRVGVKDVATLYGFASAWAGRIQNNTSDWNAIADIPKVTALLERVVVLDPNQDNGGPDLYLGVLNSIRPKSLGGEPEAGKAHFEKALALSAGRNQMVRVLYAEHYARLVFDQELHDKLLNEAIAADPTAPRLTLVNTLAKLRAQRLLETGKDYF
jgi:TRAP transporter T-component